MGVLMLYRLTQKQVLILLFVGAVGLCVSAFVLEYGFGALPCRMCWWQRYVHWALVVCAGIGLLLPARWRWGALVDCCWISLVGLGIAVWQAGSQLSLWKLPDMCQGSGAVLAESTDLLSALQNMQPPPACDDWGFTIFGLSLAMWNVFVMLGYAIVAGYGIYIGRLEK